MSGNSVTLNPKPRVTILGSGTCVPSLERSACSLLIEIGDTKIVLDAGPGTMRRLLEAGVLVHDVSVLFLSHFHPDHTGELVPFLFANKYPEAHRRKKPLTLVGGKGFARFFKDLKGIYGDWIAPKPGLPHVVELADKGAQQLQFNDFSVTSMPVEHRPESLAYRIEAADGSTVVYSGDTDISDNLVTLARNTDLFICEAAMPDALKMKGHLTPSHAGSIAKRAGVRKLVLTHFYPECDRVDVRQQCRKTFDGPLVLAKDLLTVPME